MEATKVKELKLFVEQCRNNPALLSDPSIAFFRDYLESLGAKLPPSAYRHGQSPKAGYGVAEIDHRWLVLKFLSLWSDGDMASARPGRFDRVYQRRRRRAASIWF